MLDKNEFFSLSPKSESPQVNVMFLRHRHLLYTQETQNLQPHAIVRLSYRLHQVVLAAKYGLDLMNQLDKNKRLSARELSKLRKENETLKGIMRGYVRQIDSLYTMNKRLEIDLDETSTKLNETSAERDNYKKEAEEKGEQVKKGSKLRAYNINSGALKMKTNNTTEATDRAKKVYQLKSSFTLQENVLAIAGRKTVYMSITAPNGQVLQSRS